MSIDTAVVQGRWTPQFDFLVQQFSDSFGRPGDDGEYGAQLAVYLDGEPVVDVWGGWEDETRTTRLREHALICTFSSIKGPAALLCWMLDDLGLLPLKRPIADLWPEFARNGKAEITPWHVLTHQAGLHEVGGGAGALGYDQGAWREALEEMSPHHAPGSTRRYHAITYGFILAELVLRATGKDFRTVFWERIALPLASDVHIGLPETALSRAARVLQPLKELDHGSQFAVRAASQMSNDADAVNGPAARTSINPASYGFATARGLARLYAALADGGELEGVRIARESVIRQMVEPVWDEPLEPYGIRWRLAGGFHLSTDFSWFGRNPQSFGHVGKGGATSFADPEARVSFAYMPVRITPELPSGPRSRRLVDSLFECLDAKPDQHQRSNARRGQ